MSASPEESQKNALDVLARDEWFKGLSWIEKWFANLFNDSYFEHPFDNFNAVPDWQMITNSLVNDYCEWPHAKLLQSIEAETIRSFRRFFEDKPTDVNEPNRRFDWLVVGYLDKILFALVLLNRDRPNGQKWESSYGKDESNTYYEGDGDDEWRSSKWHGFYDGADLTANVVALVCLTMRPSGSRFSVFEIYLKDQTSRNNKRASGGHNAKWRHIGKPILDANPTLTRTALATLILKEHLDADRAAVMHGLKPLFVNS